ncbi:MAG: hypothetical protein MJ128_05270 [Mogibacterium sp.]|nr:hypothetical protein [Mogibacterium sp.]
MKILIAVPTFETIYPDTFKSIYECDPCGHIIDFDFVRGYDCATARNNIAQRAIDGNYDYVLMVDNDVVLPKDAIAHLLEDPQPLCLGYYAHRDADNIYRGRTCICKLYQPDGSQYFNYPLESEYEASELKKMIGEGVKKIRIHGGGMGCAMIKTELFRRLAYPWYDWVNYADDHRGMLSEDLYFCEKLKTAGIPVMADVRVGCGHMLRRLQWPEEVKHEEG